VFAAIWVVMQQNKTVPAAAPVAQPSSAPYSSYVAGTGLIEASTENIAIGTIVPGVVMEVFVRPGMQVKAGDPLFAVDNRDLNAELAVRQAALALARDQLARLLSAPRPEEIPPAEARVQETEAQLADTKAQLELYESVVDRRAISRDELNRRQYAVQAAAARLEAARAALALLKAGTWKPEIEIARAQVASAEAQVAATKTNLERLVTRAPVDGEALQVKIRRGEYAPAGVLAQPLILFGNTDWLHVRIDVDENDAWRIRPGAAAVAFVRGNRDLKTPLEFVRVEPYVIPKKSLTGDSTERVDTRVLQLLYRFRRQNLPVYPGQQMDIFIEAPPISSGGGAMAATRTAAETQTGGRP
jgi:HlyD family secretion protein